MRLVSGFVAMGVTIGGLVAASVPAASAIQGKSAGFPLKKVCHAPPGTPVQVTGRGATGKVKDAKPAPAEAFRVDQVGYPAGGQKLAEIMTRSRHGGLAWTLIRAAGHGFCAV